VELKRLSAFGSDHFPVLVDLALEPRPQSPDLTADREDQQEADDKMAEESADESQVHQPGEAPPHQARPTKPARITPPR
jgi:hypothetical protein